MRQRIHAAFCRFHTGLLLSELEYGDSIQTISAKTNTLVHGTTVHVPMVTNWPAGRHRAPENERESDGSVAEKLDFEFDFGWRSGSPLPSQACFQYRLQPLRRTGPQFKSARPDQFPTPAISPLQPVSEPPYSARRQRSCDSTFSARPFC